MKSLQYLVVPFIFHKLNKHCTALATSPASTNQLELKYFDIRGVAETARIILAIGDENYKDTRYGITPGKFESPDFEKAKEKGELTMNLNRLPLLVLEDGSTEIGQSKAVERYLAKRFGLMGSNEKEEAMIDCVAEHCRDVKDAERRKGFSFFARDKSEEEKAILRKEWYEQDLPTFLTKIEKAVEVTSVSPFSVGESLSYADIVLYSLLRDCSPADLEDVKKASKHCSLLQTIVDNVANHEKVVEWVKNRPSTPF